MTSLALRVICDPPDVPYVIDSLNQVFELGPVRQYPTRDGNRRRLYLTALNQRETADDTARAKQDPEAL